MHGSEDDAPDAGVRWLRRLAWWVGLWGLGVGAAAALAYGLKLLMRAAGLTA